MTPIEMLNQAKRWLGERRYAYQKVFNSKSQYTNTVLADLAKFCRAMDSTFHENERVQSKLDGRREVWLRIMMHLKLSEDELWKELGGNDVP